VLISAIPWITGVVSPIQPARTSAIYAAVTDSLFVHEGIERAVVVDSTVSGVGHSESEDLAAAIQMLRRLGPLPAGIVASFQQGWHRRDPLPAFSPRVPVEWYRGSEVANRIVGARDPDSFWRAFRERYPHSTGRLAFSNVGFSSDGRIALVLVDYGCGGRCGGTIYVLLELRDAKWVIVRTAQPRVA
jgi:hypothetical protein